MALGKSDREEYSDVKVDDETAEVLLITNISFGRNSDVE